MLASKGEGWSNLINHMLSEDGEAAGIVLSTHNANNAYKSLINYGYDLGEPADGEGINYKDSKKKMENLFAT